MKLANLVQYDLVNPDNLFGDLSNQSYDSLNTYGLKSGLLKDMAEAVNFVRGETKPTYFYQNKKALQKICDVIKKHNNINVVINDEMRDFAMMPPEININSPLIADWRKQYYSNSELSKAGGVLKAGVDLQNWKVTGDFATKITISLFLDPTVFDDMKYSNEEIASIILHETGHMFSYFAMCDKFYRVNMPMLSTLYNVLNTKEANKRQIILESWKKTGIGGKSNFDAKKLSEEADEVITVTVVQDVERSVKSISGTNEYDEVNSEFLADQFASRMGCGKFLVSALDKLYRDSKYKIKELKSRSSFLIGEMINLAKLMLSPFMVVLTIGSIFTGSETIIKFMISTTFNWMIGIPMMNSNAGNGVYDNIIRRYERIRLDMVGMLKDIKLPVKYQKQLTEDIKSIENTLAEYTEKKSLVGAIADFLSASVKDLNKQTIFMKELENLANNDLFVRQARLRSLAN